MRCTRAEDETGSGARGSADGCALNIRAWLTFVYTKADERVSSMLHQNGLQSKARESALFRYSITTSIVKPQRRTRQGAAPTDFKSTPNARGACGTCTTKPNQAHNQFRTDGHTRKRGGRSPFRVPGRCGGRWNIGQALPAIPPSPATSSRPSRQSKM